MLAINFQLTVVAPEISYMPNRDVVLLAASSLSPLKNCDLSHANMRLLKLLSTL